MFVLLHDDEDSPEEKGVVALYGLALPTGVAATVSPKGVPPGQWSNLDWLAEMLGLRLVWLSAAAG